jgi:hypothetical protein
MGRRSQGEGFLKEQQQRKIKTQPGFFAALDQSGGSTPKALRTYGIKEGAWSNDKEMFALVHQMRALLDGLSLQQSPRPRRFYLPTCARDDAGRASSQEGSRSCGLNSREV